MNEQPFAQSVAAIQSIGVVPRILDVICRSTGMGFAAVARVTEDRWIACAVRDEIASGLQPGSALEIKTTLCDKVRRSNTLIVFDHADADPQYCAHHLAVQYGLQSYISVPLRLPDGTFFGTLCAVDPRPAQINNPKTIGMFEMFADLIGFHLDAADRLTLSERTLAQIQQDAHLRDRFVAVLGHDLRNPLAAIQASVGVLATVPLTDIASRSVGIIDRAAARMAGMTDNLVDLTRARLGSGIALHLETVDLTETFEQIAAEFSVHHRRVELDLHLSAAVSCDRLRVGQLLSNLIGNALQHGEHSQPVRVWARTANSLEVTIENRGGGIPPQRLAMLVHPFAREEGAPRTESPGLELFIAHEIMRAHGGSLTASSEQGSTTFALSMPLRPPPVHS